MSGNRLIAAERYPNGKVSEHLEAGDAYIMRSGGGGGFGPPAERAIEALREDVRQGYVSLEGAMRDYGVRLEPDGFADRDARPDPGSEASEG